MWVVAMWNAWNAMKAGGTDVDWEELRWYTHLCRLVVAH